MEGLIMVCTCLNTLLSVLLAFVNGRRPLWMKATGVAFAFQQASFALWMLDRRFEGVFVGTSVCFTVILALHCLRHRIIFGKEE